MNDYILDGEVHQFHNSVWKYAGVIIDEEKKISLQDQKFTEISEKLIDKYFEYLRKNFNPLAYNDNFSLVFRPKFADQPATIGIKFK